MGEVQRMAWWGTPEVTGMGRLPMRAPLVPYPEMDAARGGEPSPWWRSLDGTWRFRLVPRPDRAPRRWTTPEYDDAAWADIEVPGAWTTQGHGSPAYTNVLMPFDGEPPEVPEDNPTGLYRRTVTIPRDWRGRRMVLRVGGGESAVEVSVDGVQVGVATDSRLPSEFDITDRVRAGRRCTIAIACVQWSAATWLEDQDQWWHGGLQRPVELYSTAPTHLADCALVPGLLEDGTTGTLAVEVRVGFATPEPGWTVEVAVETLEGRRLATTGRREVPVFDGATELDGMVSGMFWEGSSVRTRLEVPRIRPWNHEQPQRYRSLVTLRNPAGGTVEVNVQPTGFRRVEVRDRQLLINGQPVLIWGVNHHEHSPTHGRWADRDLTRRDLELMKAHHINAVRASHYPHAEHFYELCDELGLYVIDEANVETHARQASLCHDPRFEQAIVERGVRMVRRDRNHPSIIAWSLGNESGYGPAHDAMAAAIRRIDPSRPLHYEGVLMHDLYAEAPVTDLVCPMYTSPEDVVRWARTTTDTRRPMILCEYSHAMGNSNGGLAEYRRIFETEAGVQGGFIWEWVDHALPTEAPEGGFRWGYGGDFGEERHDGNFCCDGLVSADRVPGPALAEVRWLNRPLVVSPVRGDARRARVHNTRWFTDTAGLGLRWSVTADGAELATGTVRLPRIAPRGTAEVRLPWPARLTAPDGAEVVMTVTTVARTGPGADQVGEEPGWDQWPLRVPTRGPGRAAGAVPPSTADHPVLHRLDAAGGTLVEAGPIDLWIDADSGPAGLGIDGHRILERAPEPIAWRAPTDNDGISTCWLSGLAGPVVGWRRQGLDRLEAHSLGVGIRHRGEAVVISHRTQLRSPVDGVPAIEVHRRLEVVAGSVAVTEDWLVPPGIEDVPRLGTVWTLPAGLEHLGWYGEGPHESYPDRRAAARLGRWSSTIHREYVHRVHPQHHGHHTGTRSVVLARPATPGTPGVGLVVAAVRPFGFSASHFAEADLEAAAHADELVPRGEVLFTIDAAMRGVGTASCGPDTSPGFRVGPGRYRAAYTFVPFTTMLRDPARILDGVAVPAAPRRAR